MDYQALLHDAMPLKWQQAAHPTLRQFGLREFFSLLDERIKLSAYERMRLSAYPELRLPW